MLARYSESDLKRADRLTFQVESARRWLADGKALFALHRNEVAKHKDLLILNPDEDYYLKMADAGRLGIITARHRGVLVGYLVWTIAHHPHYKDILCAQDDAHYLHPAYRRGLMGYFLLRKALDALPRWGVQYCYVREKIGHEHPALMQRLGLEPLDITYSGKVRPK